MSDGAFTVTVSAPAKVNLTLDVFPQRADGFHDLDSLVVCFRTPADSLTVTVRPGGVVGAGASAPVTLIVKHASEGLPKGPENLAHAAVLRYLAAYPGAGLSRVFVKLDKRIPQQAGLGGGSSDAASVLLALDELLGSLPAALPAIAAALGSDVPLFLHHGAPVRMRGRGEMVENLNVHLPKLWGVIVKPAEGVPTGPAYAALDALPERAPGGATPRLLAALREREDNASGTDAEDIAPFLANDFEAAILPAYRAVAEAHDALHRAGALRALLCGSGAAVFGLAADREHARTLVRGLVGRFPYVHLAESIATGELETAR